MADEPSTSRLRVVLFSHDTLGLPIERILHIARAGQIAAAKFEVRA